MRNYKKIILAIFIITIFAGVYAQNKIELENTKKELIEAKKPSKIEIQKFQLTNLEGEWETYENLIQKTRKDLELLEKKKSEIEPKIREKRNELLGIKK